MASDEEDVQSVQSATEETAAQQSTPRKRGRPKKGQEMKRQDTKPPVPEWDIDFTLDNVRWDLDQEEIDEFDLLRAMGDFDGDEILDADGSPREGAPIRDSAYNAQAASSKRGLFCCRGVIRDDATFWCSIWPKLWAITIRFDSSNTIPNLSRQT
jgi:hypothetical protein